jgi:uncharacterized protein YciI
MQILVLLRRRTEAYADEQFAPLLDAEAEAIRTLYARGAVRAAWTREDVPGGCLLMEASDANEARELLQIAPLVAAGMSEVQIVPLRGYRGFGPTSG